MENFLLNTPELIALRKDLHKHPETALKEKNTAKRIISFLENYPPDDLITEVGETGILAIYNGKAKGKTVIFRAELDALPIQEVNTFDHQSVYAGVSHKCGHDGHMTILCGLATQLHVNRPETGKVVLLFQPAEENGKGVVRIVPDMRFRALEPDFIFALHNLPSYPKNQILVKNSTFTCAVNSIIIKLKGKTSHAGEPEKGINPALALAEITASFLGQMQTDISQPDFCLITPIYSKMGSKAYGVSAGRGQTHFTVRSDSNEQMKIIEANLENTATAIARKYHLDIKISWTQSFHANENNDEAVDYVRQAAKNNDFELIEKEFPFTWGEDFGIFTKLYAGAMFGLGSGTDTPALHNPDYDFPDDIITTGVAIFHQIAKQITDAH
ncbi:amidohydrolase [Flavobacterium algicola]|uniref:amidohydrolase n=1 Tax=Flavobacterium algicola TaxID=556529 RepID=UPI001EFE936D|nr:amidohydrolase [Flavobacterium algicola]MCG9793599.1 amidohydrolase [Flavobacterium algicola]